MTIENELWDKAGNPVWPVEPQQADSETCEPDYRFLLGPDETGAIVLWAMDETGRDVPVSQQNGSWDKWVALAESHGKPPGGMLLIKVISEQPSCGYIMRECDWKDLRQGLSERGVISKENLRQMENNQ